MDTTAATMTKRIPTPPEDDATIPNAIITDGGGGSLSGGNNSDDGGVHVEATTSHQDGSLSSDPSAPSSSSPPLNSCRIYLKDVNPTLDHRILKSKIRSLFEGHHHQQQQEEDDDDGDNSSRSRSNSAFLPLPVKEVFLSDRNPKKHYGFVAFETPQHAQAALDMLSSSAATAASYSDLFKEATAANSIAPRNQQRQKAIQQFVLKVEQYDKLYQLVSTSRITLQVHKSHYERYRHFVLDYFSNLTAGDISAKKVGKVRSDDHCDNNSSTDFNLNVSVDHHHFAKSVTFLFVTILPSSSPSQSVAVLPSKISPDDAVRNLVNLLETKWYMQRDLGRIVCRLPPNHHCPTETTMTTAAAAAASDITGIVQASSLKELAQHILRKINDGLPKPDDDKTAVSVSDSIFKVRIHIFPPKLRKDLLDCIHDYYDEQLNARESQEAVKPPSPGLTTKEIQPPSSTTTTTTTTKINYHDIPIGRIQLSPTNAHFELTVTCFHEGCHLPREAGTYDNDDSTTTSSSSNHIRPALYLIGQLESTEKPENASRISTTATNGRSDLDVKPPPTAKRQKLKVENSGVYDPQVSKGSSQTISRAYWKLQEAWERYPYQTPPTACIEQTDSNCDCDSYDHSHRRPPIVALDCGASPGGWVKFLLDKYKTSLKRIYAVDPGAIDEYVQQASVVDHVKATIQKSWNYLVEDVRRCATDQDHRAIDIWVSDMCVKDMPVQVDIILDALERGLVGSKNLHHLKSTGGNVQPTDDRDDDGPRHLSSSTFFVLTLKCFLGHSMQTFDKMVEEQAERLKTAGAQHLFVLHLFSNRQSERTIMGYF